jgi:hypothetical protein
MWLAISLLKIDINDIKTGAVVFSINRGDVDA